jgi:tetrahydromethanopterin S-methyltransferase subunit F
MSWILLSPRQAPDFAVGRDIRRRGQQVARDRKESGYPTPREVLGEIGWVFAAHVALVLVVFLALRAFGIV